MGHKLYGATRLLPRVMFRVLARLFYKNYPDTMNISTLLRFILFQKVIGFNRSAPYPVHLTSRVSHFKNIQMGKRVYPGYSSGCYIQALNGIKFGSNIRIGPNVCIVSVNHAPEDYDKNVEAAPIEIGSNVWLGANSVILPGVKIGDNVIIGAGSIVDKDIPDNSIALGNPCRVIREKKPYTGRQYE